MISDLVIGGKSRPVRLGMAAIMQFEKITGKSILNGGLDKLSAGDLVELLRCSLISGARYHKQDVEEIPDTEGVADWMDEDNALLEFSKIAQQHMSAIVGSAQKADTSKNGQGSVKS